MIEIKFVKTHEDAILPCQANVSESTGDSGYDLYCVVPTIIPAHGSSVVPIGIKVGYITPGYWFKIESRSGLSFKHELLSHPGIIDCVPKGTLISTPNGDIKVEELFNSDEEKSRLVFSYNEENNTIEVDAITDMWIVENSELLEIEMVDDNKIQIPLLKEVYTKRGWVKAKDLTENDEILNKN